MMPTDSRLSRMLESLAQERWPRRGLAAVILAGASWSALCWLLAEAGHAPSRTLVPIGREGYYTAQAMFVLPLLLVLWLVCSGVAHVVSRRMGGSGTFNASANGLGVALSLPLATLFLGPDFVAYVWAGFPALSRLVRITAPLSFVATLALATYAVAAAQRLPPGRAFVAALAGVLGQALLGGVLLR